MWEIYLFLYSSLFLFVFFLLPSPFCHLLIPFYPVIPTPSSSILFFSFNFFVHLFSYFYFQFFSHLLLFNFLLFLLLLHQIQSVHYKVRRITSTHHSVYSLHMCVCISFTTIGFTALYLTGVYDSSGIVFSYTATRPQYIAGTLVIGSPVNYQLLIPPNANNYTVSAVCSADCTRKVCCEGS